MGSLWPTQSSIGTNYLGKAVINIHASHASFQWFHLLDISIWLLQQIMTLWLLYVLGLMITALWKLYKIHLLSKFKQHQLQGIYSETLPSSISGEKIFQAFLNPGPSHIFGSLPDFIKTQNDIKKGMLLLMEITMQANTQLFSVKCFEYSIWNNSCSNIYCKLSNTSPTFPNTQNHRPKVDGFSRGATWS